MGRKERGRENGKKREGVRGKLRGNIPELVFWLIVQM